MNTPRAFVTASALLAVSLSSSGAFAQAVVTPLPVPTSSIRAMSDDGTTIVGTSVNSTGPRAYRWRAATGTQQLPLETNAVGSIGCSVSLDGEIVGGTNFYPPLDGQVQFQEYHALSIAGGVMKQIPWWRQSVDAISDDGDTLAVNSYSYLGSWDHLGCVYRRSTDELFFCDFDSFHDTLTGVLGVNASGTRVFGWASLSDHEVAAYWDVGHGYAVRILGDEYHSGASDMSDDGRVIVGAYVADLNMPRHVFRWEEETGVSIVATYPWTTYTPTVRVSGDGATILIATCSQAKTEYRSYLWTEAGGFVDLFALIASRGVRFDDWKDVHAVDFSDDASIILGQGVNPQGQQQAFLVNLVPCRADFDESSFVDRDDFDAFVQAYVAGDASADFDASGFVDGEDYTRFIEAYESGC